MGKKRERPKTFGDHTPQGVRNLAERLRRLAGELESEANYLDIQGVEELLQIEKEASLKNAEKGLFAWTAQLKKHGAKFLDGDPQFQGRRKASPKPGGKGGKSRSASQQSDT